jgi:hypothetical protein
LPDAWRFDDARRDAAVQAAVTEFHNWRAGDWDAWRYALAAFCDAVATQKAGAGECDAEWARFHQMAARLRAP